MLSSLTNDQIALIGGVAQFACAVGVWFAGGWRPFLAYILLLPFFWLLPFVLASGHMLVALDGIVVLPVLFLVVVCARALQRGKVEPIAGVAGKEGGSEL